MWIDGKIGFLIGLLIAVPVLMRLYPPLSGRAAAGGRKTFGRSAPFHRGKFRNTLPTSMDIGLMETIKVLWDFVRGGPNRKPKQPLPMQACDPAQIAQMPGVTVTWLGHSTLLLTWLGKTMLIDPMFGNAPSPFPWLAGNRYSGGMPFEVEQLPPVDAVFLSHDHYDHLDYGTIRRLKGNVRQFFVPLGVGAHLQRWGIDPKIIRECDWQDELVWEGLTLTCTPARHFSGRRLFDRFDTLWCSWVIRDEQTRLFYSGDSGYGPHFAEIGRQYGPFDFALIECGQYDLRWKDIHLLPEEAVQAASDLNARQFLPIHWAAFTLALHDWFDPIERVVNASVRRGAAIVTPRIGETVTVGQHDGTAQAPGWWKQRMR